MRNFLSGLLLLCMAILPLDAASQNASGTVVRPLSPEAAATALTLDDPVASPDGKWVVYGISDLRRQEKGSFSGQEFSSTGFAMAGPGGLSLRAFNFGTGQTTNLIGEKGSTWGPAWSPNSRYLAFYSDRSGKATLWVWDRTTGTSRQVSPEIVHPFFRAEVPAWSHDGKSILVKLIPQGMTIDQVLRLSPEYPTTKAETNDSGKAGVTVYTFDPATHVATAATSTTPDASAMREADARFLSDLAIVNLADGHVRRIAPHSRPGWYAFSPDDSTVAFMQMQGWLSNTQQPVFDLRVVALASGAERTLVKQMLADYATGVSWAPNSRSLAYQTAGQKADNALHLVDVAQGTSINITGPIRSVQTDDFEKAGLWSADGSSITTLDELTGKIAHITINGDAITETGVPDYTILEIYRDGTNRSYWSPDGGASMIVRGRDLTTKTITLCRLDLQAGRCTATLGEAQTIHLGFSPTIGTASTPISYRGGSSSDPGSIWTADANLAGARRLSNANQDILQVAFGKTQLIEFTSLKGEHLQAALLLPSNYVAGTRYPLVVRVYGGDMGSNDVNSFGLWGGEFAEFNMQMLATRGYAVLEPDVPIHDNLHQPMQDVYDSVMPAIDRAIAMGVADPAKIGVMGQSFGGYNTISLITQTPRFAAAVATSAAATDVFEAYSEFDNGTGGDTGYYETGQGDMGCNPWECRDRYLENSPFFALDKVRTPLLMERGSLDQIAFQEGEVFVGLRRLGQEVTMLEYANEGHGLEQPANVVDFWNKAINFLNKHMGP